ncbi:unnamed protein product [Tilletia caries]|nr:unnamed protein product [Tilletia caries]
MSAPRGDSPHYSEDELLRMRQEQSDQTAARMQELIRQANLSNNPEAVESSDEVQRLALQPPTATSTQQTPFLTPHAGGQSASAASATQSQGAEQTTRSGSPLNQPSGADVGPRPAGSSGRPTGFAEVTHAVAERGHNVAGPAVAATGLAAAISDKAAGKRRRMESGPSNATRKEPRVVAPAQGMGHDVLRMLDDHTVDRMTTEQINPSGVTNDSAQPFAFVISPSMVKSMPETGKEQLLQVLLESMSKAAPADTVEGHSEAQQHTTIHRAASPRQLFSSLSAPPTHPTLPAQDMRRSATEPSSLTELSFVPSKTAGTQTRMPHVTIVNKMLAGVHVPLWHFTVEGVAAGFDKGQESSKAVLDKLGLDQELPTAKTRDADLSYGDMHAAMTNWCKVMERLALGKLEGIKQRQLLNDALAWGQTRDILFGKETARNHLTWPNVAAYIARLRENFYADAPGERVDPREWDTQLWAEVIEHRQTQLTIPGHGRGGRGQKSGEYGSSGGSKSDRRGGDKGQRSFQKGPASGASNHGATACKYASGGGGDSGGGGGAGGSGGAASNSGGGSGSH